MKKYVRLRQSLPWRSLISTSTRENTVLLIKDDVNYTFAWDEQERLQFDASAFNLATFQQFIDRHSKEYCFGYFGYDIKNQLEPSLHSNNADRAQFPDAVFSVFHHLVVCLEGHCTYFGSLSEQEVMHRFRTDDVASTTVAPTGIALKTAVTKEVYQKHVRALQRHIQRGDIYEVNYCIEFYANYSAAFDPRTAFVKLQELTRAPFSAFVNYQNGAVLCASPERFMRRSANRLVSQPIKGTAKRVLRDAGLDQKAKEDLQSSPKERAENIMIVDLVRNDLSKIATKNSVQVDQLAATYSFQTVHQLISTISCQLRSRFSPSDAIKALFPMGSMTGAPKLSALTIIEEAEDFKRGVYSGAIGFFQPNGNFDFNVVIRTLIENRAAQRLSVPVGSAITIASDPEREYEECLVKLKAIAEVLC